MRDEPARQIAVLVRHPRICGHISEYGRTAEITRIRGNEKKPSLEKKDNPQCRRFDRRTTDRILKNGAKRDGIEGLALDRLNVPEQIEQNNATGREAESALEW